LRVAATVPLLPEQGDLFAADLSAPAAAGVGLLAALAEPALALACVVLVPVPAERARIGPGPRPWVGGDLGLAVGRGHIAPLGGVGGVDDDLGAVVPGRVGRGLLLGLGRSAHHVRERPVHVVEVVGVAHHMALVLHEAVGGILVVVPVIGVEGQ